MRKSSIGLIVAIATFAISGCASAPSARNAPESHALSDPKVTDLGRRVLGEAAEHQNLSGFSLLNAGVDGLAVRVQMIRAAQRTLDLQYYIFRGDESGTRVADELRRAADRGVRVRILVDDGDTVRGDERILQLDGYSNIQVRVFNPFDYRGHNSLWRNVDFLLHKSRLDYRMHNKLLVADNAIALVGGRNVGNQYFQIDAASQFADDDAFTVGPVVQSLSKAFDEFWNSEVSVPAGPLAAHTHSKLKTSLSEDEKASYQQRSESQEPYASLMDGRCPLQCAPARLVYDSPQKREVEQGAERGRLMSAAVEERIGTVQSELLMVTPYFVPSAHELELLHGIRGRDGQVRVLSNSLESAPTLSAQSGYEKVRRQLLQDGTKLYEVRARPQTSRGTGQPLKISRHGNYALHAKLYVFDRRSLFIGSWNYDQRSLLINTEIGLLIDDGTLASQVGKRFDELTSPEVAYSLFLDPKGQVNWRTEDDRRVMELSKEPSRGWWQRRWVDVLALLPLQPEL